MDLSKEILHYAIPHRCSQCIMNGNCSLSCNNTPDPKCTKFIPNNMDRFLNDTIAYFDLNTAKSKDKKLKRVCTHKIASDDKVTTLDTYYVNFINDCISELRKGKTVYVFKLNQILEILRFVDGVEAVYQGDGVIGLACNDESNKSKYKVKEQL